MNLFKKIGKFFEKKATLIMLGGVPGSGKSYVAQYIKEQLKNKKVKIVNTDEVRYSLTGDYGDFSQDGKVFYTCIDMAIKYLNKGYTVIWDSTNTNCIMRGKIKIKITYNVKSNVNIKNYFIYIDKPLEECLENNKNRDRVCPEDFIERLYYRQDVPQHEEYMGNVLVIEDDNLKKVNDFLSIVSE